MACNNTVKDSSSLHRSQAIPLPTTINEGQKISDNSFMAKNYLKLSNLHLGSVFEDNKVGNSVFFRIVQIEEEEHVLVYVEKISIGEEGGNSMLLDRYQLDENRLRLANYSLHSLDSLVFTDSITVLGYFNDIKYKIDLVGKTAIKQ